MYENTTAIDENELCTRCWKHRYQCLCDSTLAVKHWRDTIGDNEMKKEKNAQPCSALQEILKKRLERGDIIKDGLIWRRKKV